MFPYPEVFFTDRQNYPRFIIYEEYISSRWQRILDRCILELSRLCASGHIEICTLLLFIYTLAFQDLCKICIITISC